MTMRSGTSRTWVPLGISFVVVLAVFLFGTNTAPYLRGAFVDLFASYGAPDHYASLSKQELVGRLSDAEQELSRIRYQAALYDALIAENASLKEAMQPVAGFPASIPARVIVRPPQSNYDTLVLDIGREAGVHENDLVTVHGVVLGRIVSVGNTSSLAELFSTPGVEHDAVLGEPQAVAVAKGLGAGSFEVLLPQDVVIEAGDIVRIPRSETLILGIVVSSLGEPTDATKTVRFASPVSVHALDYVAILKQQQ